MNHVLVRPTFINLNSKKIHYSSPIISLNRCNGKFNTLDVLSNKICMVNKTENENLNDFNIITGKNE